MYKLYKNYFLKLSIICANIFQKQLGFIMLVFFFNIATSGYVLFYSGKNSLLINYAFSTFFTSFCVGGIVTLISNSHLQKLVRFLLVSILFILFLLDAFVSYNYKTSVESGMINAILETNQREVIEFFSTYCDTTMMLFIIFLLIIGSLLEKYIRKYISQIPIVRIQKTLGFILILGILCTIRGVCIYKSSYIEEFLFPRFYIFTMEAVNNINEYKNLNSKVNINIPTIIENKSEIKNIVFIVGESTNRNHMSIYNYYNNTTPNLKKMQENQQLFVFKDVISPHSVTNLVLKKLFTFCNYESHAPWYNYNNIISILKLAGYKTYWLSNQESSGAYENSATVLSNLCDQKVFTRYRHSFEDYAEYDGALLPILDNEIKDKAKKKFFVIHLTGSHINYSKRYPKEYDIFHEQDIKSNFGTSQKQIIAQYDNSILYNDYIIQEIIQRFQNDEAIIIYVSDHGEEVYDYRDFFGHSEENGSKYMVEIPMVIWTSEQFNNKYQSKVKCIEDALEKPYMTDDMIHTILDLAEIETPEFDETRSLINKNFNTQRKRICHKQNYDNELEDVQSRATN
ncbi:MAG: rane protein YijP required for phosphoethanolamine modification of [Firmicutes bacterium]|nr:rane protein YijP required for phosphoethanolamine modification of [Bacillota bacterium]